MEDTRTTPTADSKRADAEQITQQAQDARTQTTSGRPAEEAAAPATYGHIETQDAQRTPNSRKRRKDNTSREAHDRYILKAYDRLELKLIAGDKSRLQAAAAALDISPTALIIRAVNAYTDAETLTEKAKNPYI